MIIQSIPMIRRTKEAYIKLLESYYNELATKKNTPAERFEFLKDEVAACKVMITHCESVLKAEVYANNRD